MGGFLSFVLYTIGGAAVVTGAIALVVDRVVRHEGSKQPSLPYPRAKAS